MSKVRRANRQPKNEPMNHWIWRVAQSGRAEPFKLDQRTRVKLAKIK